MDDARLPLEDALDDDLESTTLRGADDDAERTIVVDRGGDDDGEATIVVARPAADDDAERTIVVDRSSDDDAERTIVVDRASVADDATVIRRSVDDDVDDDTDRTTARPPAGSIENTVVVPRRHASGDEDTIVVDRGTPRRPQVPVAPTLHRPRGTGRRRGIAPPPVPAGFAPPAQLAKGPGAIETYTPRDIPPPPATVLAPIGAQATRGDTTHLPSVARRARRTGVAAVAAFAVVCLVSVVGLVLIATTLL